ncbi:MAG: response regulator [Candidatus Omnitrophica bacterium]|nr:response regulator [Candidatus Omnitrophota bacterium]
MAKKILIIDDEVDILKTLTMCLELEGYEVITADDGAAGLEKARETKPDLILLDIGMPKQDGYMTLRKMRRESHPDHLFLRTIPVVIITGRGTEMKRLFEFEGATGYITKPFDNEALLKKIADSLK